MSILDDDPYLPGGETLAGARNRVLLGLLAERDAARDGLTVPDARVAEISRWFRARFDLLTRERTAAFLEFAGLSVEGFSRQIHELAVLDAAKHRYAPVVDARLPDHRRLMMVREFLLRQEDR